jgi:phosphoglycerate dehydrogenase-like enzyme
MKNLIIISRDWTTYKSLFAQSDFLKTQFNLCEAGEIPLAEHLASAQVILGDPDVSALCIERCHALEWLQSTWAGNNKLQNIQKRDYLLTGVKGIYGQQMLEYLLSYLLHFTRRIEEFTHVKQKKKWIPLPCKTLSSYEIGIMGLGNIGQEVAQQLTNFGMRVHGLSTSIKNLNNVIEYTPDDLDRFLQNCDFVFNLLPETPATKGLCDANFFSKMKPQSVFINAGRGSIIDFPSSLINVLNANHLKAAVLDVFEQEPLPTEHPYYTTNNLYMSYHTAAISNPQKVFDLFEANAARYVNDETMLYKHSFEKAY